MTEINTAEWTPDIGVYTLKYVQMYTGSLKITFPLQIKAL